MTHFKLLLDTVGNPDSCLVVADNAAAVHLLSVPSVTECGI